jgi:arylsulfatase A-like enzyme
VLETAIEATERRLTEIPKPFMAYFHYLPPHGPYCTTREFFDTFRDDNYQPVEKPLDIFGKNVGKQLIKARREYDEFILYCDQQFAKLFDYLETSGLLDNTWVILTSDHGELHERGIGGHMTDALYQPVVRVPLLIFEPGRTAGMDIYDYTSAIDLLPTLTQLCGQPRPDWSEGRLLPPFADPAQLPERSIYVMRANHNDQYAPLTIASTMLVKAEYKLHYYFGYPEVPAEGVVRLFNTEADPEEMNDLAQTKPETTAELFEEMQAKLKEVNEPYRA